MIYQHPLGYLLAIEGAALLRAWHGDFDEEFVRARLDDVRALLADERLTSHPGVRIEPDATSEAYLQWAPTYDVHDNALLVLDLDFVDGVLDDLPPGVAVDTACGTGRLARRLVDRGHRVVGVDSSAAMVRQAARSMPDVPFVVGQLHQLPIPDASADVVTNALALTHVADLRAAFVELARVLRPGGTAIVSDVHPDLVTLGSAVKAEGPSGQPQLAALHRHAVTDYLHAALAAGFRVRGVAEVPARAERDAVPGEDADGQTRDTARHTLREVGPWRDWPWTLLDWTPEATRAAWDIPSVLAWHLERD